MSDSNAQILNFLEEKSAYKALIIGIYTLFLRNFSGQIALMAYTATIFQESGSSFSPNFSSILVAIVQIFGNICSIFLVERVGRKFLFVISYLGCTLGVAVLGTFSYLKTHEYEIALDPRLQWIPLVSFSFAIFISNCGFMAISFLYIAEISPRKVLPLISTVCLTLAWTYAFVITKVRFQSMQHHKKPAISLYLSVSRHNAAELGTPWNCLLFWRDFSIWWNHNSHIFSRNSGKNFR
jgi:MFS family permease